MDYFGKYSSNTLAGSGNQLFFRPDHPAQEIRSRTFYRVFAGGRYPYSFLFSNIIDSTYSDGTVSRRNLILDGWDILRVDVGITSFCDEVSFTEPADMFPVLFDGKRNKTVHPGELFSSDPLCLSPRSGEYLCVEIVFAGKMIPYHEESIIPSFVYRDGQWIPSKLHPFVSMIGAEREVKQRIAFLGDSITQGIGTPVNSYAHWNAVLADKLGSRYAYWNLGLGYGRAGDAAADGIWLYKAKKNDVVFVCFGVNDLMQGSGADDVKKSLQTITDRLKDADAAVIMQTVPPFDYPETVRRHWEEVNRFILCDLKNADMVFDCVPYLGEAAPLSHMAKYGGHPDENGCRVWGEALYEAVAASGVLPS